jgi:hypothetical protein
MYGVLAEIFWYAELISTAENPPLPHVLGHVPASDSLSPVTPVYKQGDDTDTANYRPIKNENDAVRREGVNQTTLRLVWEGKSSASYPSP